jgi:hypothetical protein
MAFDDPFMLAPVKNPELNIIPGMAAPIPAGAAPPSIRLASMADTSLSLGVAVQEPQVWSYDFDANGNARATFPGLLVAKGAAGFTVAGDLGVTGKVTLGVPPNNILTVTPGGDGGGPVTQSTSGTAGIQFDTSSIFVGRATGNNLSVTGGTSVVNPVTVTTTQAAGLQFAGRMGFYLTVPIDKPTVAGSRGANAALTSLLTALAAFGLVTDSTTA